MGEVLKGKGRKDSPEHQERYWGNQVNLRGLSDYAEVDHGEWYKSRKCSRRDGVLGEGELQNSLDLPLKPGPLCSRSGTALSGPWVTPRSVTISQTGLHFPVSFSTNLGYRHPGQVLYP